MIQSKNYLCYNVFNEKNINTFNTLIFIKACTDNKKRSYG